MSTLDDALKDQRFVAYWKKMYIMFGRDFRTWQLYDVSDEWEYVSSIISHKNEFEKRYLTGDWEYSTEDPCFFNDTFIKEIVDAEI